MSCALREDLRGVRRNGRARGAVLGVRDADALSRARLHDDLVTGRGELADSGRNQTDPILVHLDLARNADTHGSQPPDWNVCDRA